MLTLDSYVQDVLQKNEHFAPIFDSKTTPNLDRIKFWNAAVCAEHPNLFDFVVTLGGDGTVLYSSWLFQRIVPPVLSFSLGSLGFLTNYDYSNKDEILQDIVENGVTCSLRMRFDCTVMKANDREGKTDECLEREIQQAEKDGVFPTHTKSSSFCILNDLVVVSTNIPFLIHVCQHL